MAYGLNIMRPKTASDGPAARERSAAPPQVCQVRSPISAAARLARTRQRTPVLLAGATGASDRVAHGGRPAEVPR